ncbi:alpha-N-acetylgalactosaminidase isoform X1 [Peromyscus californicus insignis]|uniref:alpha-N-acetylgalactosaminidase isoform X1 n=2 Tax=Peromyscus californicus insignis TaxID=564181 RepID=UPI0022A6ACAA|nr:alpha-N-acetylgalactosaminidase isoform X1 [Peromyscus californicus insignis]
MLQKTVLLLALVTQVLMLENGLLRTPPMGWLAWERFRCNIDCDQDPKNCISEQLFMEMADRLAQDGWRDLGYVYLNIDDCWIGGRDASGRLIPDPQRFPHGIAFLADYAHSLGLKLGIYEDMGKMTCMGYPGTTLDKVELDAETFAEWKVDMLKLDGCYSTDAERAEGYPKMAAALNATGRPIAFSCSWPAYEGGLPPKVNYTLMANICNLWRNYDDIQDSWKSVLSILDWFVKYQDILQPVAGPGRWNDPDMLIIGNFGLSFEESRAQMALWTILAAPLFMSTDLRTISPQNMDILQNPLMIKINQDPLGIPGLRIFKSESQIEVYKRHLSNEASALVFFSRRTDMPYHFHSSLLDLKYPRSRVYEGQNVFTGDIISGLKSESSFSVVINPSGVVMWYLYPIKSQGLSSKMSWL